LSRFLKALYFLIFFHHGDSERMLQHHGSLSSPPSLSTPWAGLLGLALQSQVGTGVGCVHHLVNAS
jgi:hypothetical protein